MRSSRSRSAYGAGRSMYPLRTLNIDVLAPMPSPSVMMAMRVKPGERRSDLMAKRTSFMAFQLRPPQCRHRARLRRWPTSRCRARLCAQAWALHDGSRLSAPDTQRSQNRDLGSGCRSVAWPAVAEISKPAQVCVEEDALDLAVGHGQQDGREWALVPVEDQRRLPVELPLFDIEHRATRRRHHERGDALRALQRPTKVAQAPEDTALGPAVRDQDGIRREQIHQAGDVACGRCADEGVQQLLVLLPRCADQPPPGRDLVTRALEELPARGRAARDERRDLLVAEVEHVVEQKRGALGGSEPLQHHENGHGELLPLLQTGHASFIEVDRLGQTIAAALLAPRPRRGELVQTQACHDRHQERLRRVDLDITLVPAQPRLLDHVLRAPHVSQHAVGERQHRGPVGLEDREILRRPLTRHQGGLASMRIVTTAMVPHIDIRESCRGRLIHGSMTPWPRRANGSFRNRNTTPSTAMLADTNVMAKPKWANSFTLNGTAGITRARTPRILASVSSILKYTGNPRTNAPSARQTDDLVDVRMVLRGIQHEGGHRTERHREPIDRERVVLAAIRFVGPLDQAWGPRDRPIEGRGAHDLLGRAEVAHHVREQ